jgi:hypothetical protein
MCCVLLHLGIVTSDDGHSDSDLLDLAKINLPFIRCNPSDDDNGLSAGQESRKIQITMHIPANANQQRCGFFGYFAVMTGIAHIPS